MPFELPEGFLEGKVAIRVGYDVAEFISLFNQHISPNDPSWGGFRNFDFMTEPYKDDVAVSCTFCEDSYRLEWCYGEWYAENGYEVVNYNSIPPNVSLEGIFDLL